jgi:hypothetical protein
MRSRVREAILETRTHVPLVEIDVSDEPQSRVENDILSTPTLVMTRNGVEVSRISGVSSASSIRERLQEASAAQRLKARSNPRFSWLRALRVSVVVLAGVILVAACSIRVARQQLLETPVLSLPTSFLLWTGD